MGASEATVKGLRFMANPVRQRVSSIYFIVVLRVTTLLLVFISMVVLALALLLRPWRLNVYRGHQMEIGVWTICRITKKFYTCYDDWYSEHAQSWFLAWRYLMLVAVIVLLVTFCYICMELGRKRNLDIPWLRGSLGCGLAGILHFCSFILFYYKFEWEFAEVEFGWPIMGWNEETPDMEGYVETTGFPYIMAWVSEVLTFVSAYMCFYTKVQETNYAKDLAKQKQQDDMLAKIAESAI